jgi:FMN reductase
MLGAGPHHALAPELLLKPVLVELGATWPILLDSEWETSPALDEWVPAASAIVTVGAIK